MSLDDDSNVDDNTQEEETEKVLDKYEYPTEITLTLDETPIQLKRPGDNTPWECSLREMDGLTRDNWLEIQKTKSNMATGQIKSFKDLQSHLISRCLWDVAEEKFVPIDVIRKFPSKAQTALFKACVKLNGLDDQAETKAKNG